MFELWQIICEIWKPVMKYGWTVWISIFGAMALAQILWTFWRWIDDAEKEEEEEGIYKADSRRVVFGNLFDTKYLEFIGRVKKYDTLGFWVMIMLVINLLGLVAIFLWPLCLSIAVIYGLMQLTRWGRRLTKLVRRHNHDDRYIRK